MRISFVVEENVKRNDELLKGLSKVGEELGEDLRERRLQERRRQSSCEFSDVREACLRRMRLRIAAI